MFNKIYDIFTFLRSWTIRHPEAMRYAFNLWPPFLLNGIRVESISADFRAAKVRLAWSILTRNLNGTQFGGSLFAMSDPVYMALLVCILGEEKYYIWDKEGDIDYIRPGRGVIYFEPRIHEELIDEIIAKTANGEKFEPEITDNLYDTDGEIVAAIRRKFYIRLKPEFRPEKGIK